MSTKTRATVEDLYRVPDNRKAEIISGELVLMSPTGGKPGRAGFNIAASLKQHERTGTPGYAFGDNVGFVVGLPGRDSLSPDAAWYVGSIESMEFLQGAPVFAVEVRSKNDYGPKAEREIELKRQDYFDAGTLVVWDVDLLSPDVMKAYPASDPNTPVIFRRGDIAHAEPAIPGWRIPVEELFG